MKHLFSIVLLLAFGLGMKAQNAAALPTCSTPEFRQFDFWIGDWEVWAGDSIVGWNKVELILDECVIMENWKGKGASRGKSFNLYNRQTEKWEQTWVDNYGSVIHFSGEYDEKKGVLSMTGTGKAQDGKEVQYTLSFWNNEDGTVRQLWQASKTKGRNWVTLFDGLYKKKG